MKTLVVWPHSPAAHLVYVCCQLSTYATNLMAIIIVYGATMSCTVPSEPWWSMLFPTLLELAPVNLLALPTYVLCSCMDNGQCIWKGACNHGDPRSRTEQWAVVCILSCRLLVVLTFEQTTRKWSVMFHLLKKSAITHAQSHPSHKME